MKRILYTLSLLCFVAISLAAIKNEKDELTKDFIVGDPGIASMNSLSFGPKGILFIGDSDNAAIYAIETNDQGVNEKADRVRIRNIDDQIASLLGTDKKNIRVTDMAVNPLSKNIYFSVHTSADKPVLLKLMDGKLEYVFLDKVSYSKIELSNAIAKDAKDRRGRPQRRWAISDMRYHNGNVLVSGLSNKEFSSSFNSIPFPFKKKQEFATLEIYHAAHGKYETYAPIKTFDVTTINGKEYLLASYTCTPLVLFPIDELKGGKHLKGRTIAELGYGNSPLDIISFEKEGKPYFLMANSNRAVMRIDFDDVKTSKDNLTQRTPRGGVEGVRYNSLPMVNVLQLDNLDKDKVVYMQRTASGELILATRPVRWL